MWRLSVKAIKPFYLFSLSSCLTLVHFHPRPKDPSFFLWIFLLLSGRFAYEWCSASSVSGSWSTAKLHEKSQFVILMRRSAESVLPQCVAQMQCQDCGEESSPCRVHTSFLCISSLPSCKLSSLLVSSEEPGLLSWIDFRLLSVSSLRSLFHPLFLPVSLSSGLLPHTPHKAQAWLSRAGPRPAVCGLWLLLLALGLNWQVYGQRLVSLSLAGSAEGFSMNFFVTWYKDLTHSSLFKVVRCCIRVTRVSWLHPSALAQ